MMLICSVEAPNGLAPSEEERIRTGHRKVMEEAAQKGVLIGAEPLAPTSAATTVRIHDGKPLVFDGPFAETKEQLAGYYIIECAHLDEAIEGRPTAIASISDTGSPSSDVFALVSSLVGRQNPH